MLPIRQMNRTLVLEAISEQGKARTQHILTYINTNYIQSRESFLDKILTDTITTIPVEDIHLPTHKQRHKTEKRRPERMDRIKKRTVIYVLKQLVEEGLINKDEYNYYRLTNTVKEDPRYLPKLWNLRVLGNVFNVDSMQKLVNNVGFMVVYSLVMSTKPFAVGKSGPHKNELALQWLHDSVSLEWLLMSFMAKFVPIVRRGGDEKARRFEIPAEKFEELSNRLKAVNPKLFVELHL